MNWDESKLGDVAKVISGYAFKSKDFSKNKGVPVIKIKNIQKEKVEISDEYFLDESFLSINSKFHCVKDDVLISLTGSHITLPNSVVGRVAKYHYDFTSLLNQRGGKIVVTDENKLVNNYLYYFLCQHQVRTTLALFGRGGANQVNISPSNVESIKIDLPPLQTQKRIADILSDYDDLIENNLKRIKILEQTAQNIYKEWFVNLRFPGHENTPSNEETGLPEGWEEKGLCEFTSFKQYKTKIKTYEGEKEYLATANISGIQITERGEYFSFNKKPSRAQIAPPLNSVWFARMSNTDKVLCFTENTNNDLMISSGFAGFKAENHEFLPFLFCTINNDVFSKLKDSYSTGSTQVSINNKSINSIRFIEPEIQIMKEFGNKLYPSLEMINKLFVTNKKLKEARDILLPRLMNRTIEV